MVKNGNSLQNGENKIFDKIFIERLQVFGRHGVLSEENTLGQMFFITAELGIDLMAAGKSDDLDKTVNYAQCCAVIKDICENNTYKLIETLAEKTAERLLCEFPLIYSVRLRVDKPSAPIGLPLDSVGVEIYRCRHTAYIALGSNMGDKRGYLENAVKWMDKDEKCRVLRVSPFIVTEPVGGVEQDDFLNGCLCLETLYTPDELLDMLNALEQRAERVRAVHWGPRTLDLDIIFYDDAVIQTERLTVPHALMHTRGFVLEPLAEIAPYAVHPVFGKTVRELLDML